MRLETSQLENSTIRLRTWGAIVALLSAALLLTGAWLTPITTGIGTHGQLGLPACPWEMAHGMPCPTCGMTTAVSLAAHGRIGAAFGEQPAGALLAVFAAMGVWAGLWTALTGCPAARGVARSFRPIPTIGVVLAVVAAAWAYTLAVH